ncbi:acetylornithine transaminase [Streptococcus chenjunshii]|uniref:Acetylornithine aminotransferase n=1 Tax=Streptococcus chenjunshii TaxID=2173853 RepID=A0A372KLQ0_9STRE|nr:acetylornithine transaminase [Streptococcus chenjunshii]AXQ78298.1 acetylornithine transaminase [Streptococcus chenjunshii]RFU50745.1 acetylornithine transaminase [Streptococcus chenjunshii]RFU52854.1 acetylornithine transaminase [Streptococcus chenjunshii]
MGKLFNNYQRVDIEFIRAEGNYLFDQEGKAYLDFSSGIGVTNLGFHPAVKTVLKKQAEQIWHTPNLYQNSLQEEVADKLIGFRDYLAYFCNSGAEANEAAIKLARKSTGRQEIISFKNSFHGRTFGSLSASGQDAIKQGFGDGVPHFYYASLNDLDSVKDLVTDDTAAVMLELVQGESGIHVAHKDFVRNLADFCRQTGILLIIDEVQTGMGRTGKLFAFEHYGIEPDIFTLAKGLGNGFPVGAMLGKASLGEAFSYGSHGSTFGGNKLAMAASSAVLDILKEEGFLDTVLSKAASFKQKLAQALANQPLVTEIRGMGYMIGIETESDLSGLVSAARAKGLIILTAGRNVLRLLPPLTLTEEEGDRAIAVLQAVFEEQSAT